MMPRRNERKKGRKNRKDMEININQEQQWRTERVKESWESNRQTHAQQHFRHWERDAKHFRKLPPSHIMIMQ